MRLLSYFTDFGIEYIMLKSFLRSMSVSMLIVGTMIGAGFASGREIVTFFGEVPNAVVALIAGVLVFACSVLFLFVGRRVKKSDIGEVNGAVFGKCRALADIFMLFNSVVVLGAMLAGTDSLVAEFIDLGPLPSIVIGILCAIISARGLKGLLKANAALVPIMVVVIAVACILAIEFPLKLFSARFAPHYVLLYVAMNMILGGGVLTTVNNLSPREILLSSAVASAVISALLMCITAALHSCSAAHADLPMLLVALKSGKVMYFVCLFVIGAAIFTTMLTAFKSLYDYLFGIVKYKWLTAALVLASGLFVGAFGFSNVVGGYPIIVGIGLVYIACNIWYLIRTRVKRKVRREAKKVKAKVRREAKKTGLGKTLRKARRESVKQIQSV